MVILVGNTSQNNHDESEVGNRLPKCLIRLWLFWLVLPLTRMTKTTLCVLGQLPCLRPWISQFIAFNCYSSPPLFAKATNTLDSDCHFESGTFLTSRHHYHDVWYSGVCVHRCAMYIDLCWCPCERTYCTCMDIYGIFDKNGNVLRSYARPYLQVSTPVAKK